MPAGFQSSRRKEVQLEIREERIGPVGTGRPVGGFTSVRVVWLGVSLFAQTLSARCSIVEAIVQDGSIAQVAGARYLDTTL